MRRFNSEAWHLVHISATFYIGKLMRTKRSHQGLPTFYLRARSIEARAPLDCLWLSKVFEMNGDLMMGGDAGLQGQSMAPFLTKLFQIVSNLATDQAIIWTPKGDSFVSCYRIRCLPPQAPPSAPPPPPPPSPPPPNGCRAE